MSDSLYKGLKRFKRDHFPRYKDHYVKITQEQQTPHALFIGCADSRVDPSLLTSSIPGDLFVVRNVGNLVAPFSADADFHGIASAIEYAVVILNVKDVVVCGHSHCGAIRSLYEPPAHTTTHVDKWLQLAEKARVEGELTEETLRKSERQSVKAQLEHLMTYPMVYERVERGDLAIHGWHYVIEEGMVYTLDMKSGEFLPIEEE